MKGAELTISTIIIIVLALAALIALIAFLLGIYNPAILGMGLDTATSTACKKLTTMNCLSTVGTATISVSDFDADKDGTVGDPGTWDWASSTCGGAVATNGDNLASLCACYYGITSEGNCRKNVCKCP